MINEKIKDIIDKQGSSIIVMKGIDKNLLPSDKKYFTFDIDAYDTVDLEKVKEQVVEEVIEKRNFNESYLWLTGEEYQLFKEHSKINKMPICLLENNLYDKQYPYQKTLSDIESIYKYLYYNEDNELNQEQLRWLENVSNFYGQIDYSKASDNYYITYPEDEDDIVKYTLYDNEKYQVELSDDYPLEAIRQVELSEDETSFLDLEADILEKKMQENILFVLSGSVEFLPNKYLERINILSKLTTAKFYFTSLSIKRKVIEKESQYLDILRDKFGYDSFNEIPFYKNIENQSKEKISISQVQIIDDIVNQAERAMHGETFRDIYITASTGAGKSLMFQIPALYLAEKYKGEKPLTLVISPLIGLMNDQVSSLKSKGVDNSETINGDIPPYEKEKIIERVQNQEVDVLYLSPETLQARSDIKMLIGERTIGVVIIDEAHIVTTWGKSFRADYWYLGIYLSKLRKAYQFPIVTFTATSIYGGPEDMYLDTRNSLNMISPISYFGDVRRNDIWMLVSSSERELERGGRDYRKTKNTLALKHLKKANKKKEKSLIYFPTIKLLLDCYDFINKNEPELAKRTGKYYGSLRKEEKDEVLSAFKEGDLDFVLATKAFGMGIDIPDITNVYHYAPTGNVVDYVQEIGRAARDKEKVKNGYGIVDFLPRDMNEVKQLYGMSAIKKAQILEVMKKILSTYREKGNNRNMIISPEDFKYIFVDNKGDEESLDNKVKTVLLMIEKDFSSPNKLGYSPFVARPRSLFGNDLIFVTAEEEIEFVKSHLGRYFTKVTNISSKNYTAIYQVDLSGIWEKHYRQMTFPSFKYSLFKSEEREKLKHKYLFNKFRYSSGIEAVKNNNYSTEEIIAEYKRILGSFEEFINQQKITESQFTISDLGVHLSKTMKIADKFEARTFAQTIINSAFEFNKVKGIRFIAERSNSEQGRQRYIINQDGKVFSDFILSNLIRVLQPIDNYNIESDSKVLSFYFRMNNEEIDSRLAALGIGEARGLLNYQLQGGHNPQIYLRMNSVYPLEKAIKQGDFYKNIILQDVQNKHYISVEMLKYLFTKEQEGSNGTEKIVNFTKWFWDNIEDYFMGIIPNQVRENISKGLNP